MFSFLKRSADANSVAGGPSPAVTPPPASTADTQRQNSDAPAVTGPVTVTPAKSQREQALERELLACYNLLVPGSVAVDKLPDVIIGGCVSDTVHAFTTGLQEYKARLNAEVKALQQELEKAPLFPADEAALRDVVEKAKKEELAWLYNAGDRLRILVNHRWQQNR